MNIFRLEFQMNRGRVCERILESSKLWKRWYASLPAPRTHQPMKNFVDKSRAPSDFEDRFALVFSDIISEAESDALIQDIHLKMKRKRWEEGHWDSVITKYKETELDRNLSPTSMKAIERLRCLIEDVSFSGISTVSWLPSHAIHLHKDGKLSAHVDSVKFSGKVVCGLSLLSDSIMRLKPHNDLDRVSNTDSEFIDLYLPQRSLYILSGKGRYKFTHEILQSGAKFRLGTDKCIEITRDDRMSVIFRDAREEQ